MSNVVSGRLRTIFIGMATLAAIFMLVLGSAPTAAAVTALTITTTYPSVQVDPGGQVDLPILVESPTAEKVDLSVTGAPDGFTTSFRGGGFIVTSIYVTPSSDTASPAPNDLKLRVEVPDGATPQAYNLTVQAPGAGWDRNPADHAHRRHGRRQRRQHGHRGRRQRPPRSARARASSLTLHNDTAADQSFSVTVPDAPDGWDVTATPSNDADPNNFTVGAGDTDTISVTANSPSTAAAGDYTFTVVASAGTNNTASLQLGVRLTGTETLSLTSQSGTLNTTTSAGSTKDFSVIVVNNGSSVLNNVKLDSTPPTDWTITYDPATIAQLQPNTQQTVVAHIATPGNDGRG